MSAVGSISAQSYIRLCTKRICCLNDDAGRVDKNVIFYYRVYTFRTT